MIAHMILFTPRAGLGESERAHLLESLAQAVAAIPSIRRFRIGRRVTHGLPGYEQLMREDYQYAALLDFDDVEGLKAYLAHPAHGAVGKHFTVSADRSLAYDYEIMESKGASG